MRTKKKHRLGVTIFVLTTTRNTDGCIRVDNSKTASSKIPIHLFLGLVGFNRKMDLTTIAFVTSCWLRQQELDVLIVMNCVQCRAQFRLVSLIDRSVDYREELVLGT